MTKTVSVQAYTRRKAEKKPDPLQPLISKRLEQIRAKANADKRVNEFRDEIGYRNGSRPVDVLMVIASKLKRLAQTGRA